MSHTFALVVAVVCYLIALNLRIELQVGDVSLAPAFAPVFLVVGVDSLVITLMAVAAAGIVGVLLLGWRERTAGAGLRRLAALAASTLAVFGVRAAVETLLPASSMSLQFVLAGAVGVLIFALVSDRVRHLRAVRSTEDGRVWLVLVGVLISAYGLMALAYNETGWPALVAVFGVLALTKREFDRYAAARRTLDQTVASLAGLARVSLP